MNTRSPFAAAILAGCLWLALGPGAARAQPSVAVIASSALGEILQELAPEFERTTGHKLTLEFDSSNGVKKKIEAGATFDVAIVTPAMILDLSREGKLTAGPGTQIARAGYGVAIRAGAARPDIGTTEAFRQALLDAKSVIYNTEGQSGIYIASMMERLGIAEQMRPKTTLRTTGGSVAENVARGEVELGFQSMSEILSVRGAELLGPLPAELQRYTLLVAGLAPGKADDRASRDFIRFMGSVISIETMKKHGVEALRQ